MIVSIEARVRTIIGVNKGQNHKHPAVPQNVPFKCSPTQCIKPTYLTACYKCICEVAGESPTYLQGLYPFCNFFLSNKYRNGVGVGLIWKVNELQYL